MTLDIRLATISTGSRKLISAALDLNGTIWVRGAAAVTVRKMAHEGQVNFFAEHVMDNRTSRGHEELQVLWSARHNGSRR